MRLAALPAVFTPRPRICVIGYKSLSRLVYSVAADYQGRADIEVIDEVFDRSIGAARARESAGLSDVFVSAGANAEILRNALRTPVATWRNPPASCVAVVLYWPMPSLSFCAPVRNCVTPALSCERLMPW